MADNFKPLKDEFDKRYLYNLKMAALSSVIPMLIVYIFGENSLVDIDIMNTMQIFGLLFVSIYIVLWIPKGLSFEEVTSHSELEYIEDHEAESSIFVYKDISENNLMVSVYFAHGPFDLEYDISLWFKNKMTGAYEKLTKSELQKYSINTEPSISRSFDEIELQQWLYSLHQEAKKLYA